MVELVGVWTSKSAIARAAKQSCGHEVLTPGPSWVPLASQLPSHVGHDAAQRPSGSCIGLASSPLIPLPPPLGLLPASLARKASSQYWRTGREAATQRRTSVAKGKRYRGRSNLREMDHP